MYYILFYLLNSSNSCSFTFGNFELNLVKCVYIFLFVFSIFLNSSSDKTS